MMWRSDSEASPHFRHQRHRGPQQPTTIPTLSRVTTAAFLAVILVFLLPRASAGASTTIGFGLRESVSPAPILTSGLQMGISSIDVIGARYGIEEVRSLHVFEPSEQAEWPATSRIYVATFLRVSTLFDGFMIEDSDGIISAAPPSAPAPSPAAS